MTPLSLSPFGMMRRFSEEMDRIFNEGFGTGRTSEERNMWMPAVEVHEHNGNVEISAELPGIDKQDVKVECTEEGLIIEGEKRREKESDEGGYHHSERSYGHFYRMIPLPDGSNTENAKAEFKNGVLHVRIPINEQMRKNRQIPISG
jgi:HSP20 family protein